LRIHELQDEDDMHVFTVGVCLPAALLIANKKSMNIEDAVEIIGQEYTGFKEIYFWAKNVLPAFDSEEEQEKYIEHMSTKGGITEAIVESLNSGNTFLDSLRNGITRSKEISTFASFSLSADILKKNKVTNQF
jgi:pyrroline-5-carboxylate reductase